MSKTLGDLFNNEFTSIKTTSSLQKDMNTLADAASPFPKKETVLHKPILEFQDEYRWLSNFAECTIHFNGYKFKSVEHAYQAAKCANAVDIKAFVDIEPGHAKRLGRKITVRSDWEEVKIPIMRELLVQKFFHNYEYGNKLLATHNSHIQEGNRWHDKFWGICLRTDTGENNLGKLIMEIRAELNTLETNS